MHSTSPFSAAKPRINIVVTALAVNQKAHNATYTITFHELGSTVSHQVAMTARQLIRERQFRDVVLARTGVLVEVNLCGGKWETGVVKGWLALKQTK